MCTLEAWGKYILGGAAALTMLASLDTAHAGSFSVLHAFAGGTDGAEPAARLIKDSAGNFYGTTSGTGCSDQVGCGTVFKLAADGKETVLYAFSGGNDGAYPQAGLTMDSAGNLYGTTETGGGTGCPNQVGCGTIFEVAPDGKETLIHAFAGGSDGFWPLARLTRDSVGNLYGTTAYGGTTGCGGDGCGTVFELTPDGTKTVLYAFTGGSDAAGPVTSLRKDSAGNLYGTTYNGGGTSCNPPHGCGTVFELTPGGTETVLYAFTGGSDGRFPAGDLIRDAAGNFYGTTEESGNTRCGGFGCGTVFELTPDGTLTVLYTFAGGSDGAVPEAGLIKDSAGNFYGTTAGGGTGCSGYGCGTIFELALDGKETVLHAFVTKKGSYPEASLIRGPEGDLYGTTYEGGTVSSDCTSGCGTVFKLKK